MPQPTLILVHEPEKACFDRLIADGIEQDFIAFDWGRQVRLAPASRVLRLVVDR